MNRRKFALQSAVVFLAGGLSILWAAPTPRNPNVRAESWVQVSDAGLRVKQVQTFRQSALEDLWKKLDANGDGRVTPEEKKSVEAGLKPLFTDHTTLKVNWNKVDSNSLTVSLDSLPQRRPKNINRASQSVTFVAAYPVVPSKEDVVELSIPDLDAHESLVHFAWDGAFVPLRTSMGHQGKGNVWDMGQTDGVPNSFSVVFHRQPAGVDSLPSKQ